MLNLSQATVSIGFSIRNGAPARNLLPNSICGGCLRGACRIDLSGVVLTQTEARQSVDGPGADKIIENRRPRLDQYH